MYGNIPERPFNAILDSIDKKHIVHRRINREHLNQTKGELDVTMFTSEVDDSIIVSDREEGVTQKDCILKVRSFKGHDGDTRELEDLSKFFDANLLACQGNPRQLIELYKGDNNC